MLSPLKMVDVMGGDVFHAIKSTDNTFHGFGEAYFSSVDYKFVKGWKRHSKMYMNLIVPVGEVRFVAFDDREDSSSRGVFQEVILSLGNYQRLTVPPCVWLGFQGMSMGENILLNIASIPHDPRESDTLPLDDIGYSWN